MKGIILAGGSGTRLYPATKIITKQLLDVGGKPMIYYPLTQLMLSGIKKIMIISSPENIRLYRECLGTGEEWGIELNYCVQDKPEGIAQAFILPPKKGFVGSREFIGNDKVTLILGDNIFYGPVDYLDEVKKLSAGALVFAKHVSDPQRFGVVEFDTEGRAVSLEEKPSVPKSNYAVTGLYSYDNDVVEMAGGLKKSDRGELEITDLNRLYLKEKKMRVVRLRRGIGWFDTGTKEAIENVRHFILLQEKIQNVLIGSPEEIAYRMDFISKNDFENLIDKIPENSYKDLLIQSLKDI